MIFEQLFEIPYGDRLEKSLEAFFPNNPEVHELA